MAKRLARKAPREPTVPLASFIGSIAKESERAHRRIGKAVEVWCAQVPAALGEKTRLDAIRGSTLHVVVADSPTLWSLDRLLRSGLCDTIAAEIGAPVRQVRLRVGSIETTPESTTDPRRQPRWT